MLATSVSRAVVRRVAGAAVGAPTASLARSLAGLSISSSSPAVTAPRPATVRAFATSPYAALPEGKEKKTKKKAAAKKAAAKKPAAKKPATKKKAVAKKPAQKKKAAKPPTPEQQEKAEIKELKRRALLKLAPKTAAVRPWNIFVAEKMPAERARTSTMGDAIRAVKAEFDGLSYSEMQRLESQAAANKEANEAAYKAWIVSLPVDVVYLANRARRRLARLVKDKRFPKLVDDRLPRTPRNPFVQYIQSEATFPAGRPVTDSFRDAATAWKSLPDYEKRRFEDQYAADKNTYDTEMTAIRAQANKRVKADKAADKAVAKNPPQPF
ncbi:HMG (high mobility group) box [Geosmithia morbida]|uniref:HMG (High mobility group) box n=1 Tax=Geosmithia morbida TaxID=1094350 RepID=A0A9P4YVG9_9HYPO|nr:HMG (high mobility group) box [Geosmithia morbida]KAF4122544.1 HMG (high mobility group) box [Geosmithia morbida]